MHSIDGLLSCSCRPVFYHAHGDLPQNQIKMKKSILFVLICLCLNALATGNESDNPSIGVEIIWSHAPGMPYAAMFIPVQLVGDTNTYIMQFDFGAPNTVFYQDAPNGTSFKIGDNAIELDSLRLVDLPYRKERKLIGTIGMDALIKSKLRIDFKNSELFINPKPNDHATYDFYLVQEKIIFPAKIDQNPTALLYDSGSSAFDLITDKQNWDTYRLPETETHSYPVKSWGRDMKVHVAQAEMPLEMAGVKMVIDQIAHVEGMDQASIEHMRNTGMGGMIGNTLFIDKVLYLDFQNKKFSILAN